MAITKEVNEVISLAKEFAMNKIKGNQFSEIDTHNFFKGFIEIFSQMNELIDIEKMKDLIQPNFQVIYMLMKANKNKEINCLVFALDEDDFIMKNIHSLTAIKEFLMKNEINIKNDRLILKIGTDFYYAEIFDGRSFEYESMCCGNCNHTILTDFRAKKIPEKFLQKVKYIPDIEIDYKTNKEELKFIICDKCLNLNINEDIVRVLEDTNISYTYVINNKEVKISGNLYHDIKMYFWQTQKDPINIIFDTSYKEELKKYLDEEELEQVSKIIETIQNRE